MLSYQHLYHAGNMADVHKHAFLAWCLAYMTAKDKPLSYIETHAGRGLYDLAAPEAVKTGEAAQGIALARDWFAPDHPYRQALAKVAAQHGAQAYPGSPLLAASLLRDCDPLHLAELHPREFAALDYVMSSTRARLYQQDGAEMALSICPPDPRRGLLLIDPSYEVKTDYQTIPALLRQVHRKWPVGVLILWYPLLAGDPHRQMIDGLIAALPDALRHEVRFPPARPGHRMSGSGVIVINSPYGLAEEASRLTSLFAVHAGRA